MSLPATVVIGLLGTTLDTGGREQRWERWRPTVDLCRHPDFVVDRLELLADPRQRELADVVARDIAKVSPETEVRHHALAFRDARDFEEVYGALFAWTRSYPFAPERERYLLHITTGTHVAQICWFLLTEFWERADECGPGSSAAARRSKAPSRVVLRPIRRLRELPCIRANAPYSYELERSPRCVGSSVTDHQGGVHLRSSGEGISGMTTQELKVNALRKQLGKPPRKLLAMLGYKLLRQRAFDAMKNELVTLRRSSDGAPKDFSECMTSSILNYLEKRPKAAAGIVKGLRDSLHDEESRQTLDVYLWRLEALVCKSIRYRDAIRVSPSVIANASALDYERAACDLPKEKQTNDCAYGLHMMSPELVEALLSQTRGRVAIDGGAYDGGTSSMLLQDYGASEVHAFEPVSFDLMTSAIGSTKGIVPVKAGLHRENAENVKFSYFEGSLEGATMTRTKEVDVPGCVVHALDSYGADMDIGCVKLDVEGAEYDAICGMEAVIRRCKPVLLISVYHTGRDLFEIRPLLSKWRPDYRFLMRHIRPFKPTTNFLRWEYLLYAF